MLHNYILYFSNVIVKKVNVNRTIWLTFSFSRNNRQQKVYSRR